MVISGTSLAISPTTAKYNEDRRRRWVSEFGVGGSGETGVGWVEDGRVKLLIRVVRDRTASPEFALWE